MLNIQGMDPSARSAGRWKVDALKHFIEHKNQKNCWIPFISITETWLQGYMTNAQVKIPHYEVFRADRDLRIRGGSLLYIHEDIPVINSDKYSDKFCQAIVCTLSRNVILASVYRPPEAPIKSICNLVDFLQIQAKGPPPPAID